MIYTFNNFEIKVTKFDNGILLSDQSRVAVKFYPGDNNIFDKGLIEFLFTNDYSLSFRKFIENSER